jgi:hypothetical protein
MAPLQVASIQIEAFVAESRWQDFHLQIGVSLQAAPLCPVHCERTDRNPARHTGTALRAVRNIDMAASTTIAALQAKLIDIGKLR